MQAHVLHLGIMRIEGAWGPRLAGRLVQIESDSMAALGAAGNLSREEFGLARTQYGHAVLMGNTFKSAHGAPNGRTRPRAATRIYVAASSDTRSPRHPLRG